MEILHPTTLHQLIEDVFGALPIFRSIPWNTVRIPCGLRVTGDSAGGHLSGSSSATWSTYWKKGALESRRAVCVYASYIPPTKSVDQVKEEISRAIKAAAPSYGPSDAVDFKDLWSRQIADIGMRIPPSGMCLLSRSGKYLIS